MKKKIRSIVASTLSLAIAMPIALHADENTDTRYIDIDSHTADMQQVEDNYNQAVELLTLDREAIDELTEAGLDLTTYDDELTNHIIDFATHYLGRPYRHGAKGPSAFDCSGFTSYVFGQHGIDLNASSRAQYTQGTKIDKEDIRPGDLLFFGGRAGGKTVGHVAIAVDVDDNGTVTFIHASTTQGITYDSYPDGGYYSKRYIGARRVIE